MKLKLKVNAVQIGILIFSTHLALSSCSTSENKEVDIASIDPNAPALPPEDAAPQSPNAVENVPTPTSETLVMPPPASPTTVVEEPLPPPASTDPVVTPKVEELTPVDQGTAIGTLDDDAEKDKAPSKPKYTKAKTGTRVFGTGKQKRFIRADQLHIRAQPDRFSKSLGLLYGGDEVHVTIRGGWAKLEDGQWIRSRWLVKKSPRKFQSTNETSNEPTKKVHKKSKKRSKKTRRPSF